MSNCERARPIPLDPPVINAIGDDIVYILLENDLFGDANPINDQPWS